MSFSNRARAWTTRQNVVSDHKTEVGIPANVVSKPQNRGGLVTTGHTVAPISYSNHANHRTNRPSCGFVDHLDRAAKPDSCSLPRNPWSSSPAVELHRTPLAPSCCITLPCDEPASLAISVCPMILQTACATQPIDSIQRFDLLTPRSATHLARRCRAQTSPGGVRTQQSAIHSWASSWSTGSFGLALSRGIRVSGEACWAKRVGEACWAKHVGRSMLGEACR